MSTTEEKKAMIPMNYYNEFIPAKIKNGTPHRGVISNHYRYRAIGELKCPILN